MLSLLTTLLLATPCASAQSMALDPQNRVHAGLNVVDGPSGFGVTVGLDSRLTRFIALDIGGFLSPAAIPTDTVWVEDGAETPSLYRLRHGLYAAPGVRIPHPQPKTWAWEVFVRAGGGVVWAANLSPDAYASEGANYLVRPAPSGFGGGDALVRFGRFGVRASGKAWLFSVTQTVPVENFLVIRSQWTVEGLVQW